MKNATKITLIVAAVCIALGLVLSTVAIVAVNFDFRAFSTASEKTKDYYFSERGDYQKIKLEGSSKNYSFIRGENDTVEFEYYSSEQFNLSFHSSENELFIKEEHYPQITMLNLDFDMQDKTIVVKLPQSFKGDIDFGGRNSDISIQEIDIRSMNVRVMSGNVYLDKVALSESGNITTASGSIDMNNVSAESINAEGTSSHIGATSLKATEYLSVSVLSGNISLSDVETSDLKLKAGSGDIQTENIVAALINAETMSGTISGAVIESPQVKMKTTSGRIELELKGDSLEYKISTYTRSGKISAPSGNFSATGSVELETTSGDIALGFTPYNSYTL